MKWEWVRRGLVGAGIAYLVILIPANIRPAWRAAPFRKPNQTITVQADDPHGTLGATAEDEVRKSCRAAWFLRPIMGSAKHIRVLATWNDRVVQVREYNCVDTK